MFGFKRKRDSGRELIERLHAHVVEASRRPELYLEGGLPDTMEGRFEALTLHALVVLRRLRELPPPADDVAQELVDALFAHLEIALREMGIGDFGVPKRMKKLAQAFFDRTSKYDALIADQNADGLASEIAARLGQGPATLTPFAGMLIASDAALKSLDLGAILAGPPFVPVKEAGPAFVAEASR